MSKLPNLSGLAIIKILTKNFGLLYIVKQQEKTVTFTRYRHHDIAYKSVPDIAEVNIIPFEQWVAQHSLRRA